MVNVASISKDTMLVSFAIKNRYSFSYWDSLILSSALENGCNIIYSEDMQDGQLIDGVLRVVNPFQEYIMRKEYDFSQKYIMDVFKDMSCN